jgi:hypothetical protein
MPNLWVFFFPGRGGGGGELVFELRHLGLLPLELPPPQPAKPSDLKGYN